MLSQQLIETTLAGYQDPYLQQDLVTAKAVKKITIVDTKVQVEIQFGYPCDGFKFELQEALTELLQALDGVELVQVQVGWKVVSHAVQNNLKPMPNVRNIIAVASGKGGVGKSTVAANLALALQADGARVGLLDADIYGPSQPRMLGVKGKPTTKDQQHFTPMVGHGIQNMSIGYLVDEDTAMIWRGPMVISALDQLLNQTTWDDLDYLIIDLPPGTGDVQLSLSQKIPVSGAVIVTTPQDIALLDARRGINMFEKVNVTTLGVIENMSTHMCSNCGHEDAIFGEGGGAKLAAETHVPLLGKLPLDGRIRQQADSGTPTVAADVNGELAQKYIEVARNVSARLSLTGKDFAAKFPKIVIE